MVDDEEVLADELANYFARHETEDGVPLDEHKIAAWIVTDLGFTRSGGWRDISTAPKDGTWILALADCTNTKYVGHGVVQWRGDGRTANAHGWYDDRRQPMDDATHWQPLSPPPVASAPPVDVATPTRKDG